MNAQSKHGRPNPCGRWSLTNPDASGGTPYLAMGCKSWDCPRCAPRKATKLRKAITRAAEEHGLTRFLTLTLDTARLSPEDLRDGGIRYIRGTWAKLRTYLARRAEEHGERRRVEFVAVVEMQVRGVAHLHVLVDRFIPHAWIRDAWVAVGGGRIVDIRQVDLHRVSAYLATYITKQKLGGLPHRVRRYTTSRGVHLAERVRSLWGVVRMHLDLIETRMRQAGRVVSRWSWDELGMCALMVGDP